ncbi:MAG: metallophosphoesterase [Desulfomonilaceae bacterium]
MKKLKLLVISDTHLGEPTSLLSYPQGLWHLWENLRTLFNGSTKDPLEIDELILLGDIPDRTLSSTSEIITHTNAFIQTLGSAANINKGVYVPGNHDHTLWTKYVLGKSASRKKWDITKPAGERLIGPDDYNPADYAKELLTVFFGFNKGSAWRRIVDENRFEFYVANPLYAKVIKDKAGQLRTYVFAHGTHFKSEVCAPEIVWDTIDRLELDSLAGLTLQTGGDVHDAKNLLNLERIVTPFVDSLWPSSGNNSKTKAKELWYLYNRLRSLTVVPRQIGDISECFDQAALKAQPAPDRVRLLVTPNGDFNSGSIQRWKDCFLPHMLTYLKKAKLLNPAVTFVYGDTHEGGWGYDWTAASGEVIRIYNTGAWVVDESGQHPPCHIFAVDEDGEEYMADISFNSVSIDGEFLLSLAGKEVTLGNERVSAVFRATITLLLEALKKAAPWGGKPKQA